MIGETVGSYRVGAKLGEGGMGVVYAAEHKYIARRAAIKFLLPELSGSPDVVSRFFSEARAASLIRHPGIVEVLDCEVHRDGRAYIVMELLAGESLRAYLDRRGKMDADVIGALGICRQIANVLAVAHAQGIVHRDLKPDNVFLHLSGDRGQPPIVKLLDFGIAKLLGGGEAGSRTRTGQLLGTPLYMSPEQCRGARQVDRASDIYSLGCIMFEMFCGRPPFLAEGLGDLIIAHVSQPPPDPLQFAPSMSNAVKAILLRCLAKAPADRPASMNELSKSLAALGAPDALRLASPVAPGLPEAPVAGPAGPQRATPDPALAHVATTPFPGPPDVPTPSPRRPAAPAAPTATPSFGGGPEGRRAFAGGPGAERASELAHGTLSAGAGEILAPHSLRRRPRTIVVAAALAVGGVAAALAVLSHRGASPWTSLAAPTGEAATGVVPPKANELEAPPASPRPSPSTPPPPAVAHVRLTGLPSGAIVRLDGQPASLPLVVPQGSATHQVTVEAAGYERWEGSVDGATTDQTLAVALTKVAVAKEAPPSHPKHKTGRRHGDPGFSGFNDL